MRVIKGWTARVQQRAREHDQLMIGLNYSEHYDLTRIVSAVVTGDHVPFSSHASAWMLCYRGVLIEHPSCVSPLETPQVFVVAPSEGLGYYGVLVQCGAWSFGAPSPPSVKDLVDAHLQDFVERLAVTPQRFQAVNGIPWEINQLDDPDLRGQATRAFLQQAKSAS